MAKKVKHARVNLDRLAGRLRKETQGSWQVQKRVFLGVVRLKEWGWLIQIESNGSYTLAGQKDFDLEALKLVEPTSGKFPTLATIEATKVKIMAEHPYFLEEDFEMLGWGVHTYRKFRVALLPCGWRGDYNGELCTAETHAILIEHEWEKDLQACAQMQTVEISVLEKDYFYLEKPDIPVRHEIHCRLRDEHMAICLEDLS